MADCMTTYPFQVRADAWAELRLPDDLTAEEVERICAYIKTLAPAPAEEDSGGA